MEGQTWSSNAVWHCMYAPYLEHSLLYTRALRFQECSNALCYSDQSYHYYTRRYAVKRMRSVSPLGFKYAASSVLITKITLSSVNIKSSLLFLWLLPVHTFNTRWCRMYQLVASTDKLPRIAWEPGYQMRSDSSPETTNRMGDHIYCNSFTSFIWFKLQMKSGSTLHLARLRGGVTFHTSMLLKVFGADNILNCMTYQILRSPFEEYWNWLDRSEDVVVSKPPIDVSKYMKAFS